MSDILDRLRSAEKHSMQAILGSDIFKVAADEFERLQRRLEVAGYERERFQALNEALVKKLAAISLLTCPDDVVLPDGRRYAFKPPDEHVREAWEGLTKAIRSIDEALRQNAAGLQELPTGDSQC